MKPTQQPQWQPEPPKPHQSKKLYFIIGGAIAGLLILSLIVFIIVRLQPNKSVSTISSSLDEPSYKNNFEQQSTGKPAMYASNAMYDACNIVPWNAIQDGIPQIQNKLDTLGDQTIPEDPLTIEHSYVDHSITSPLGKDAAPRPKGTSTAGTVSLQNFLSSSDSNCWYGSGNDLSIGYGETYLRVAVTQKPTPLSGELLHYARTLQSSELSNNTRLYSETKPNSGGLFSILVAKESSGIAVFLQSRDKEFLQVAGKAAAQTLAKDPEGSFNLHYPEPWQAMPNPCALLPANTFEQATQKTASPLAKDVLNLTEIGGRQMQRTCNRLEVERLDGSEISESNVAVRMAPSEEAAKKYIADLKTNTTDEYEVADIKQRIALADESHILIKNAGTNKEAYALEVRVGAAIIQANIVVEDKKDASQDEYTGRMVSIMQAIVQNYKDKLKQ